MTQSMQLWLYALVVFGVVVLPGLEMAFVLASSMVGGRRAGMAAVAGCMVGGACHMTMSVLGVSVVLRLWPALFNAMMLAGAAYVGWIGWSLMRTRAGVALQVSTAQRSTGMTFLRATLTCLMNPKAYVFMLAVVPQFLRPAAGPVWLQACALSAITAATQAGVYGGLALLSVRAGAWLGGNPDKAAVVARLIGGMLALSALVAGVQGWQQTAAAG